jgi:hypothetical protein
MVVVSGRSGEDGINGLSGKTGTINIMVVHPGGKVERFGGVYNFAISSIGGFVSDSGLIEPGQYVATTKLCVKNTGLMPSVAGVEVFMNGNAYLVVSTDMFSRWTLDDAIKAGAIFEHPESKQFQVTSNIVPPQMNSPLQVDTFLDFYAVVPRTLRCYKNMCSPVPIHIQYPVEMSVIQGGSVCVPGEMVPFTIVLRNLGRVALGLKARCPRVVYVRIEALPAPFNNDLFVRIGQRENVHVLQRTKYSLMAAVSLEVDYLAPMSELILSGAIGIDKSCTHFYERSFYRISLNLGPIDNPLMPLCIQQEQKSFQIGEYFAFPSTSMQQVSATGELTGDCKHCLLVVHCYTTKDEIAYWKELFAKAGLGLCIFNVSIYHGLSYFNELFNLYRFFTFNCVVILNSPFARDDNPAFFTNSAGGNGSLFYPLQYVALHEIFDAARHCGIRTFVVNTVAQGEQKSSFATNFPKYLKPLFSFPMVEADKAASTFDGRNRLYAYMREKENGPRDELLPRKNIYCRIKLFRVLFAPNNNDFVRRIREMSAKLNATRPDRQYFL